MNANENKKEMSLNQANKEDFRIVLLYRWPINSTTAATTTIISKDDDNENGNDKGNQN